MYKCAGVWDSKAREAKCDLGKSLRKMLVSNLSPLFGKEILSPPLRPDKYSPAAKGTRGRHKKTVWRPKQGFSCDM